MACAVSDCENKYGYSNRPKDFRFYLGDSHACALNDDVGDCLCRNAV